MLNIVVLLKQTFDTEEKIIVTPAGISDADVKLIINPYDEYALEEALRQRELHGGQVRVVTCGNDRAEEALRTALAMGADEAIRLSSDGLAESDSYVVAAALAEVIRPLAPDLLLAGLFAVDSGSGSVALQVAERLELPHASAAVKVDIAPAAAVADALPGQTAERYAIVERDVEGDAETVVIPLPALITAQQGLNEPRYPSLPGIMKAKRKPLTRVDVDASQADLSTARTARAELFPPAPRAAGKRLTGTASEQAAELVRLFQAASTLPQ